MISVPIFEVKNKLSYYLHKCDEEGPIFVTNHGKVGYVIQPVLDYEKLIKKNVPQKTIVELFNDKRKEYGLEDDDFDFSIYLENLRKESVQVSDRENKFLRDLLSGESGENE